MPLAWMKNLLYIWMSKNALQFGKIMAEKVNTFIDNLIALFTRLFDLPLIVLIVSGLLIAFLIKASLKKLFKLKIKSFYFYSLIIILISILIIDHKFKMLEKNLDQLNIRMISNLSKIEDSQNKYDLSKLNEKFESLTYWEKQINPAVDLVVLRKDLPKAVAYIGIIDLNYPGIEILITPEITEKFLTSKFARQYDCDIAINGEAGESMQQGCALGEWTGNMIVKGKAVLLEDSEKRPFLSFNKFNQAKYFKSKIVDISVTDEKYNTIWGRFDLLVNGEFNPPNEKERPYSRTIMAIDEKGSKLYLMIVDGKRPNYSMGLSYDECAAILKELGAYNGMACDQGGSSCMYLKTTNGIINRPADSDGLERIVYTHFGVKVD
jgi:hypothetical protein